MVNIIEDRTLLTSGVDIPLVAAGGIAEYEALDSNSSRAAMRRAFALSRAQ
jgi:NAD(P)H-dependent flavin oxidoreductase YrpB (nitropropane dioxygenase family)